MTQLIGYKTSSSKLAHSYTQVSGKEISLIQVRVHKKWYRSKLLANWEAQVMIHYFHNQMGQKVIHYSRLQKMLLMMHWPRSQWFLVHVTVMTSSVVVSTSPFSSLRVWHARAIVETIRVQPYNWCEPPLCYGSLISQYIIYIQLRLRRTISTLIGLIELTYLKYDFNWL